MIHKRKKSHRYGKIKVSVNDVRIFIFGLIKLNKASLVYLKLQWDIVNKQIQWLINVLSTSERIYIYPAVERAVYSPRAAVLVHWVLDCGAAERWGWCRRHAVESSRSQARWNEPKQTLGHESLPGRSRGQTRTGSPPTEPECRGSPALDRSTPLWHPTQSRSDRGREDGKVKGDGQGTDKRRETEWRQSKRHERGKIGRITGVMRRNKVSSVS